MVDTRRLDDCFSAIDYFESRSLPYVVALNLFDGVQHHELAEVRAALNIDPAIPVMAVDARDPSSTQQALLQLVGHAIKLKREAKPKPTPDGPYP